MHKCSSDYLFRDDLKEIKVSKNKDCSLVQDLLKLYREDLLSPQSKAYVEEHLSECEMCRRTLEELDQANILETQEDINKDKRLIASLKKWKYELIGFIVGIVIVFLGIFGFMTIPVILNITGHVDETVNNINEYGKQKYKGVSKLSLFPKKDEVRGEIKDYYYHCEGERIYQNYQIYLEVKYDNEAYEEEKERLLSIYNSKTEKGSRYTEEEFVLPGVYSMLYADGYEYALMDDSEASIKYIYLQGVSRNELYFDIDYLPKDYGRAGSNYETERRPYSIYQEW